MRLSDTFDGEINFADFTPEELQELFSPLPEGATNDEIKKRYFSFYDDIKDKSQPFHKWSE